MVEAFRIATGRDRKIHPRIFEHPLGVVGFQHGRLGREQGGIEPDRLIEVGYGDVYVQALHADLLRLTAGALAGVGTQAGTQAARLPPQQFSVR